MIELYVALVTAISLAGLVMLLASIKLIWELYEIHNGKGKRVMEVDGFETIDEIISGSYEREKELDDQLDFVHKYRHELQNLKMESNGFRQIEKAMKDFEAGERGKGDTLAGIQSIIRLSK